jgi:hypothetical protein
VEYNILKGIKEITMTENQGTVTPEDIVEGVEDMVEAAGIKIDTKMWYFSREIWSAVAGLVLLLIQVGLGAPINPQLFYVIESMLLMAIGILRATGTPTKLLFKQPITER